MDGVRSDLTTQSTEMRTELRVACVGQEVEKAEEVALRRIPSFSMGQRGAPLNAAPVDVEEVVVSPVNGAQSASMAVDLLLETVNVCPIDSKVAYHASKARLKIARKATDRMHASAAREVVRSLKQRYNLTDAQVKQIKIPGSGFSRRKLHL